MKINIQGIKDTVGITTGVLVGAYVAVIAVATVTTILSKVIVGVFVYAVVGGITSTGVSKCLDAYKSIKNTNDEK